VRFNLVMRKPVNKILREDEPFDRFFNLSTATHDLA
jgi:hypothetical protein